MVRRTFSPEQIINKLREVVGAALNKLLRLAFALVKNQTFYQVPQLEIAPVVV